MSNNCYAERRAFGRCRLKPSHLFNYLSNEEVEVGKIQIYDEEKEENALKSMKRWFLFITFERKKDTQKKPSTKNIQFQLESQTCAHHPEFSPINLAVISNV